MSQGLLDTDVLHKAAHFGLLAELLSAVRVPVETFFMLGSAKYVVYKLLEKRPPNKGTNVAIRKFDADRAQIQELEPTGEEVRFSAEFERMAQERNLSLDGGESLLCTILSLRRYAYLFTGDKRAISAIQALLEERDDLLIDNNVACLEQLFYWILLDRNLEEVREAVCSESRVDIALFNSFACSSDSIELENCLSGLQSYINDVRAIAAKTLLVNP